MNLGEFHSLVSQAVNRGTTLDSRIPGMVKLAVQWMERNYTFTYMERFRLLQVAAGDRTIDLPTNEQIKGFRFIRMIQSDNYYNYLNRHNAMEFARLEDTLNAYWVIGNRQIVFNAVPTEALNGEASWYAYTSWPEQDATEHPLLTIASDVVLAQTLLFLSVYALRDMRMAEGYKAMRDEGVNTLTRAEDEVKYASENLAMEYRP